MSYNTALLILISLIGVGQISQLVLVIIIMRYQRVENAKVSKSPTT